MYNYSTTFFSFIFSTSIVRMMYQEQLYFSELFSGGFTPVGQPLGCHI